MTTRKELQAWLDQFPEDAEIEVIITEDDNYGYERSTFVSQNTLDLTEDVSSEGATYARTFETEYDYKNNKVTKICFGVKN